VNGNEIMKIFGLKQGKIVGEYLQYALDKVVDGECKNTWHGIINLLKNFKSKYKKYCEKCGAEIMEVGVTEAYPNYNMFWCKGCGNAYWEKVK